jgi:hypothetical protein
LITSILVAEDFAVEEAVAVDEASDPPEVVPAEVNNPEGDWTEPVVLGAEVVAVAADPLAADPL